MNTDLSASLNESFGFSSFRPGQAEAIQGLLEDKHVLVVMPTGAGKSLVYQLAALQLPELSLVISPLISLMKDQVDGLQRRGIAATFINSTLAGGEQRRRLDKLAQGDYRLVYIAPERLRSAAFLKALQQQSISLLAVDEAHCISEWGHDFRPDYLHIGDFRAEMGDPLTVSLTATATPQVQDDILRQLKLSACERIITGFNRPNLAFEVRYSTSLEAKLRNLRALLVEREQGGTIIYVGTRRDAEEVAEFAREVSGVQAQHYHAGLEPVERTHVQEIFLTGEIPVIAATNAFGMGIDRPDVRQVIHYSIPGTLESYYQEAGRAGRDGQPARAVLLYAPQDRALQEWFIENSVITIKNLQALYKAISPAAQEIYRTWDDLSRQTGLPEVEIKVGLAELERAGAIERLGDTGGGMRLRCREWDANKIQAGVANAKVLQDYKRDQLERMIVYAETDACRRRILLDHFGDRSPPEALDCCDNCREQPAPSIGKVEISQLTRPQRTALIILDTIRRQRNKLGRQKVSQILKGSQAADIKKFHYDRNTFYGRLAVFSLKELDALIEQLIDQGYLKVTGGKFPVLNLSPRGETALKEHTPIALELPRRISPETVGRKKAERKAGGTLDYTAKLFEEGQTPEQIAKQRELTLRTIYGHLAQLIAAGRISVDEVVPDDVRRQVEEAINGVGSVAYLAPIKAQLPASIDYGDIRCVVEGWKIRHAPPETRLQPLPKADRGVYTTEAKQAHGPADPLPDPGDAVIERFLERSHPRQLPGLWSMGWAIDFYSRFTGANWSRSTCGELAYRLKYEGDLTTLEPLIEMALEVVEARPELSQVDAILPVPPSSKRDVDPVLRFAEGLAKRLDLPVKPYLVKTRTSALQKEMHTRAQKFANVAGAFVVKGSVSGQRLLVVDDLFDSGATLEEITRVLLRAKAARVNVLTLTRTIHATA